MRNRLGRLLAGARRVLTRRASSPSRGRSSGT